MRNISIRIREIEFKAKRADNGEWVIGSHVIDPKGPHKIYWKPFEEATSNTYHHVMPDTVCQYTGLKDKNGVKIFENDLINPCRSLGQKIGVVTFNKGCFMVTFENGEYAAGFYENESSEVVGNIFDNREMINT